MAPYSRGMPIPPYVAELREHIGTALLWLPGVSAYVLREHPEGGTQLLLVRRSDNGRWTPVTGICDPGEDPDVTAAREVLEETCVTAQVERLIWVQSLVPIAYPNGDEAQYLDIAFCCRYVSGEARVGDDESSDVGWFDIQALPQLQLRFHRQLAAALSDEPGVLLGGEGRRA